MRLAIDENCREYGLKELKKLLLSYPELKTIKSKLTGSLPGPISAPKPTPNMLWALRRLLNLPIEAGFTAERLMRNPYESATSFE